MIDYSTPFLTSVCMYTSNRTAWKYMDQHSNVVSIRHTICQWCIANGTSTLLIFKGLEMRRYPCKKLLCAFLMKHAICSILLSNNILFNHTNCSNMRLYFYAVSMATCATSNKINLFTFMNLAAYYSLKNS